VLSGDKDVVDTYWLDVTVFKLLVLDDDLRFAIWSQPWNLSIFSLDGHFLANEVGKNVGVWMKGLGVPFVGSITEHESLITGSHIHLVLSSMDGSSNVGILSVNIDDDLAIVAIETYIFTSETNFLANLSGNLLEVDL
jgi:hypothetical protein